MNFTEGQHVVCCATVTGCTDEDYEVTLPAGSQGQVEIVDTSCVHVFFKVPVSLLPEDADEDSYIVNVFDMHELPLIRPV